MPTLYIVATPIGNLEDITLRAIRALKEADLILCEDTRVTKKLLQKYEIETPTMSYHAHSKLSKVDKIFGLLEEGKNLALVSDAGTPTISDPGVLFGVAGKKSISASTCQSFRYRVPLRSSSRFPRAVFPLRIRVLGFSAAQKGKRNAL